MKSQFYASRAGTRSLVWGEPLRIEQLAGEFVVMSGRVWLTREGDLEDYVLEAGESFDVASDDVVVVEPWKRGAPALIAWRPGRQLRPQAPVPRCEATGARLQACA